MTCQASHQDVSEHGAVPNETKLLGDVPEHTTRGVVDARPQPPQGALQGVAPIQRWSSEASSCRCRSAHRSLPPPPDRAQVHVRDQWVIRLVADRQTDEAHENVLIIVWNGADHASTSIDRESSPRILMPH